MWGIIPAAGLGIEPSATLVVFGAFALDLIFGGDPRINRGRPEGL